MRLTKRLKLELAIFKRVRQDLLFCLANIPIAILGLAACILMTLALVFPNTVSANWASIPVVMMYVILWIIVRRVLSSLDPVMLVEGDAPASGETIAR